VVLLAGDLLAWLWGIAGAFLAVPLTVTIILVCPHVPALEPIAVLLGGGTDESEADPR
jgi:AI-2 transport protein TqsA